MKNADGNANKLAKLPKSKKLYNLLPKLQLALVNLDFDEALKSEIRNDDDLKGLLTGETTLKELFDKGVIVFRRSSDYIGTVGKQAGKALLPPKTPRRRRRRRRDL